MRHIIVATDKNNAIGRHNALTWQGQVPSDMQRFKDLTTGHAVVMGRKTYDSIGHPLPNRLNIVLSSQQLDIKGCTVTSSIENAFEIANEKNETFVIGGEMIYKLALPYVDTLYITQIKTEVENADAFFVDIDSEEWKLIDENYLPAAGNDHYDLTFQHYVRSNL